MCEVGQCKAQEPSGSDSHPQFQKAVLCGDAGGKRDGSGGNLCLEGLPNCAAGGDGGDGGGVGGGDDDCHPWSTYCSAYNSCTIIPSIQMS